MARYATNRVHHGRTPYNGYPHTKVEVRLIRDDRQYRVSTWEGLSGIGKGRCCCASRMIGWCTWDAGFGLGVVGSALAGLDGRRQ